MKLAYLPNDPRGRQLVRGRVLRMVRDLASGLSVLAAILLAFMWFVVKKEQRVGTMTMILAVWILGILVGGILARFSVVEVKNGTLQFAMFGIRTRTVPIDAATSFRTKRLGRSRYVVIAFDGRTYVPNGALDSDDVIRLMRSVGIEERSGEREPSKPDMSNS